MAMRWKRALLQLTCLLALVTVGLLAAMEWLYRHTLAEVPTLPPRPRLMTHPAERIRLEWWMDMEGSRPQVQPVWPWTVGVPLLKLLVLETRAQEFTPSGFDFAGRSAFRWSRELGRPGGRHLSRPQELALAVWLTRHWNVEELVLGATETLTLEGQDLDLRERSRAVLGKEWAQLDVAGVALIKAFSFMRMDPWCAPERVLLRRNWLLRNLHAAGGLTTSELEAAIHAPFALAARPRDWPLCAKPHPAGTEDTSAAPR